MPFTGRALPGKRPRLRRLLSGGLVLLCLAVPASASAGQDHDPAFQQPAAWPAPAGSPQAPAVAPQAPAVEEEPWRVQAVDILGLENITRQQALEIMETKPAASLLFTRDPQLEASRLERDCTRLTRLYQEYGFFETKVSFHLDRDEASRRVSVTFTVQEGRPTLISDVDIQLPEGRQAAYWRQQIKAVLGVAQGQRFSLEAYQDAKKAIARLLNSQAHPMHKLVGQVRVYRAEQRAQVVFKLDPGPRVLFGTSTVSGHTHVDPAFILREVTYARGQPYSQEALDQSQRALLDTGFFSSVSIVPDFEHLNGQQVPLNVQVKEGHQHTVRLGLGWGNEDQFRVRVTQVNRNMLGLHDTLTFEGKISYIYYGLTGRLKLPYIINHNTNLLLGGGVEQKDNQAFINRRYFVSPVLEYRLQGKWLSYLGYNAEVDRMRELKTNVPNPDQEKQQHRIFSVPLGLRYDSRDSVLDAKRGLYLNLELETASELLGSDLAFLRPVAEARHVMPLPLFKGWYLASRAKAGAIFNTTGLDRAPMIRRFFLGGADSVRGYPYQGLGPLDSAGKPLGGEAMVEASVEARFPLWGDLGGVVFLDMGNAYETLSTDMGKLRFTSGLGLRYNTPVGPLRLDVGYQLNPPADIHADHYEVYLSVGQAF
ncbi:MAG: BamA/TamA family outer membrane protein [Pseudomonadota bacterium]